MKALARERAANLRAEQEALEQRARNVQLLSGRLRTLLGQIDEDTKALTRLDERVLAQLPRVMDELRAANTAYRRQHQYLHPITD